MDFSKLNLGFAKVVLCISRLLPNKTRPKFGQDCWKTSVLNWWCWMNQSTQCPLCLRQCFYCSWKKWITQLVKPIHKPQSLIVRIEGRVCFANSVYLGFRTCWSSEDWPTVTKGISDIGLRREQALENEIKNDVSNMEKGTRTHT